MSAVYDRKAGSVYISARELCEYTLRGGDIGGGTYGNKCASAIVPHKLHCKKPEISDAYTFSVISGGITITVYTFPEGVAKNEKGEIVLERIYSVDYPLDFIENGELEIAIESAMCSSYILCEHFKMQRVNARVVFCREKHEEMRTFAQVVEKEELTVRFENLIDMFLPFAKIIVQRETNTVDELSELHFPFPKGAREGQRDFIVDAFTAIKAHKRLVVQAPTGTGKTMASLYPSLKSIGRGYADKVFYFTGKTTTAMAALGAVDIMRPSIPDFRSIHITSKEKCCTEFSSRDSRKCSPKYCKKAAAFYDKINVALSELLEENRTYTKEIIDKVADKYSLCSYELSLELSEWCELIVCDYNYLFDLQAYFRRYFDGAPDADYIFLIDEAHNLPDRAREMYSSTLLRSKFISVAKKYSQNKLLSEPLDAILHKFDVFYELAMAEKQEIDGEVCGFYINTEIPDDLTPPFEEFVKGCKKLFSKGAEDEELNNLYFEVKHMLSVCDIYDKRFTMYVEAHGEEVMLRLLCLDPSHMLDLNMRKGISSILFSATLTPLDYFSDVLGCQKSNTIALPSPFDREKLCLVAVENVSTRYEDRKKSAPSVANIIRASIAGKKGKYIVYFPSYTYLESVKDVFSQKYPKINLIVQRKSMSEKAKKEFLDAFDAKSEGTLVGFCVMGGSFSEGIDLRGERLIGAIIVGVGLPTISSELNIIKEYFDKTRENGYAYAYTYPGMNKVLQAAGRVIRSEEECGVVVLIDDRFATPDYKILMPDYWHHIKYINNANTLLACVTQFWQKHNKALENKDR